MNQHEQTIYGARTWSIRTEIARPLVMGMHGIVSAGHYLAASAGMRVLAEGGNAIDAGVAGGLVLNVVHNDMCAFAGVAPIILYHAGTKRVTTFAGTGTWPRAISRDYFIREKQGRIGLGLAACVVPSAPAAWLSALRRYGTKTFGEVASDAIRIARDGFPVHHFMARSIRGFLNNYRAHPMNREIYLRNGEPPEMGDVIVQRDLAETLRAMADAERKTRGTREDGIDAAQDYFYRGPIAKAMVAYSRTHGGFFTEEDFAAFEAREEAAPCVAFRNHQVYGCGPWSQGPAFLEALGILDGIPMEGSAPHSPEVIHHMVEALKLAFADRERYLGDPLVVKVPMEHLLSRSYLAEQRARIDPHAAYPGCPPAGHIPGFPRVEPPPPAGEIPAATARTASADLPGTSYLCAMDREGNIFSATPSDGYSQSEVIPGLGLAISERGLQGSLNPDNPNVVAPGKRIRLTPNPALVLRDGEPFMAIGSPGADRQPQAMTQVLSKMLIWRMNPQQAVEHARFASYSFPQGAFPHQYEPGKLRVEADVPEDAATQLRAYGHDVERWPKWSWSAGGVCVVMRDPERRVFVGGADPRREGYVVAV